MKLNFKLMVPAALLLTLGVSAMNSAGAQTYVGSWDLANVGGGYGGPYVWTADPTVYNAKEAAAVLFGGVASDYVISTVDSNPMDINHLAFVDGWGDDQYLFNPQSESFSVGTHYNSDHTNTGLVTYSALVVDHAPFDGGSFVNYAFRVDGMVPEPGAYATLLGLGVTGAGALLRRRRQA